MSQPKKTKSITRKRVTVRFEIDSEIYREFDEHRKRIGYFSIKSGMLAALELFNRVQSQSISQPASGAG